MESRRNMKEKFVAPTAGKKGGKNMGRKKLLTELMKNMLTRMNQQNSKLQSRESIGRNLIFTLFNETLKKNSQQKSNQQNYSPPPPR